MEGGYRVVDSAAASALQEADWADVALWESADEGGRQW